MSIDNQVHCTSKSRGVNAKRRIPRLALAALTLASFGGFASAQVLPNDAKPTCSFGPTEVPGWFETGAVTPGGAVKPANSVTFSRGEDCNYYKWASRMFLWLTSPAASGGGLTFESPEFYSVSSLRDHKRTLTQNEHNIDIITVRGSKPVEYNGQPRSRSVLMARNRSLVYYASQVNEVYALFLTGVKTGAISPWGPTLEFPNEQDHLDKIVNFAKGRGIQFGNPNTLTLEVKSAWIEATGLDTSKYITMNATIPVFKKTALTWKPNGTRTKSAKLALVGMHVVGSVNRTPTMLWATFEHINNVPMAPYKYYNTSGTEIEIRPAPAPAGTWQFSAHNCTAPFNRELIHARQEPTISASDPRLGMAPSDTCRVDAWGTPPADSAHLENNTNIIAINSNIIGKLAGSDVRKNYLLVGATWNSNYGASQLANTTLETYDQGKNCSFCHNGNLDNGNLSHIWGPLQPLR